MRFLLLRDRPLLSTPEPDNGGAEAERERDWRSHAADLCRTRAHEPTCRHVDAIRYLRCDDSPGVDELGSQYRSSQQQAAGQSDERRLQIPHGCIPKSSSRKPIALTSPRPASNLLLLPLVGCKGVVRMGVLNAHAKTRRIPRPMTGLPHTHSDCASH